MLPPYLGSFKKQLLAHVFAKAAPLPQRHRLAMFLSLYFKINGEEQTTVKYN